VITGAKRKLTGKGAIDRFGCDVLICDDAFQHRQIVRDIDIVLLDAEKPLGNGHLLPRGRLREPVASLHRASCLIITRSDNVETLQPDIARIAEASSIPVFRATHKFTEMIGPDEMRLPPRELRGKKVCAFCGIAKPASFKKLLLDAETDILSFIEFSDHYAYDRYDLEGLKKHFLTLGADYWITTEKDAMRLAAYPEFLKMLCVLRMEMEIKTSEPSFEYFITERLNAITGREVRL